MFALDSRIAIVTGGTSGIGFATVNQLLREGYKVAFFGQNEQTVSDAVARIRTEGQSATFFARSVDLKSEQEIDLFFSDVHNEWGPPDTLVCNAGISPKGADGRATPFAETTLAEWNNVLAVNLSGAMLCCRAAIASMRQRHFGRVIVVGSVAGRSKPNVAGAAYVASKAGLSGLCRSLVAACDGLGITINLVAPGRIVTPMAGAAGSDVNQAALKRIPIGRLGEPDDVARLIAFLASPGAGFINGAIIDVNGGEFLPA